MKLKVDDIGWDEEYDCVYIYANQDPKKGKKIKQQILKNQKIVENVKKKILELNHKLPNSGTFTRLESDYYLQQSILKEILGDPTS